MSGRASDSDSTPYAREKVEQSEMQRQDDASHTQPTREIRTLRRDEPCDSKEQRQANRKVSQASDPIGTTRRVFGMSLQERGSIEPGPGQRYPACLQAGTRSTGVRRQVSHLHPA